MLGFRMLSPKLERLPDERTPHSSTTFPWSSKQADLGILLGSKVSGLSFGEESLTRYRLSHNGFQKGSGLERNHRAV